MQRVAARAGAGAGSRAGGWETVAGARAVQNQAAQSGTQTGAARGRRCERGNRAAAPAAAVSGWRAWPDAQAPALEQEAGVHQVVVVKLLLLLLIVVKLALLVAELVLRSARSTAQRRHARWLDRAELLLLLLAPGRRPTRRRRAPTALQPRLPTPAQRSAAQRGPAQAQLHSLVQSPGA